MQRGKQTSRISFPPMYRLIDLGYRIQATSTRFRQRSESFRAALCRWAAVFRSRAKQWTSYEERRQRREFRKVLRRQELRDIARRLHRTI